MVRSAVAAVRTSGEVGDDLQLAQAADHVAVDGVGKERDQGRGVGMALQGGGQAALLLGDHQPVLALQALNGFLAVAVGQDDFIHGRCTS
jgi:hypothetical protein